jgi:hypothetical protein
MPGKMTSGTHKTARTFFWCFGILNTGLFVFGAGSQFAKAQPAPATSLERIDRLRSDLNDAKRALGLKTDEATSTDGRSARTVGSRTSPAVRIERSTPAVVQVTPSAPPRSLEEIKADQKREDSARAADKLERDLQLSRNRRVDELLLEKLR